MSRYNDEWGKCIRNLLDRHGLTLRAAEKKCEGKVSHTTISDWCTGVVPTNLQKAWDFVNAFPQLEAAECLRSAGLPLPADLADRMAAPDPQRTSLEAIEYGLRQTHDLTDEGKRQILDFAKRIAEKYPAYGEKADKEGEGT